MINIVAYIREICQERNIPVSQLERECGFSNGYLNPKKLSKIPYARAVAVSSYLDIPLQSLLDPDSVPNTPTEPETREIGFDDFTYAMQNETKDLTNEDKELLLSMARQLKAARQNRGG